jgi:uncharacterized protein (DUF1330 family)
LDRKAKAFFSWLGVTQYLTRDAVLKALREIVWIPAFDAFGARLLARGNAAAAYERGLKERILIIEFSSLEKAIAAHDSPAYQEALKALGDGAVRDVRIVEGVE